MTFRENLRSYRLEGKYDKREAKGQGWRFGVHRKPTPDQGSCSSLITDWRLLLLAVLRDAIDEHGNGWCCYDFS